jgi:hypothetical protein
MYMMSLVSSISTLPCIALSAVSSFYLITLLLSVFLHLPFFVFLIIFSFHRLPFSVLLCTSCFRRIAFLICLLFSVLRSVFHPLSLLLYLLFHLHCRPSLSILAFFLSFLSISSTCSSCLPLSKTISAILLFFFYYLPLFPFYIFSSLSPPFFRLPASIYSPYSFFPVVFSNFFSLSLPLPLSYIIDSNSRPFS